MGSYGIPLGKERGDTDSSILLQSSTGILVDFDDSVVATGLSPLIRPGV